jgi:hypothetical protein
MKLVGSFFQLGTKVIPDVTSAEEVELRARKEGVTLETDLCRKKVILEFDCSKVIRAFVMGLKNKSSHVFVIRETLQTSASLPEVCFQAVQRDQNIAAYELAQLAKHTSHTYVWHTQVPLCVRSTVIQD